MNFFLQCMFFLYNISHVFIILSMELNQQLQFPKPTSLQYMPWRENYRKNLNTTLTDQSTGTENTKKQCVFCLIPQESNDDKNYILYRGNYTFVTLPTAPYINDGFHFLVIPYQHGKELYSLSNETRDELNSFTKELCARFSPEAHQAYIGLNLGKNAAASIPDHLHRHMVFDNKPPVYSLIQAMKQTNKILDLPATYQYIKKQFPTLEISAKRKQIIANSNNTSCNICARIKQNVENDKANLVIYRGKSTTILFEECPSEKGHINIVPTNHIESLEEMPTDIYYKINKLTIQIYPLLLKILAIQDIKIGMTSCTSKSETKEHIRQQLIPCPGSASGSYVTIGKKICLTFDVENLYNTLREEIKKILEEK